MGLVREAKPVDDVEAIGSKLAALSKRPDGPWSFQVVDTSLPGRQLVKVAIPQPYTPRKNADWRLRAMLDC